MRQLDVPLHEVVSLPWNPQLDLPQPLYSPLRQSCRNRNRAARKVSSAVGPKLERCAVWPGCRLAHTARSGPSPSSLWSFSQSKDLPSHLPRTLAARLRITWRASGTGEVRRRQLLLPSAATNGPIASYVSLC